MVLPEPSYNRELYFPKAVCPVCIVPGTLGSFLKNLGARKEKIDPLQKSPSPTKPLPAQLLK